MIVSHFSMHGMEKWLTIIQMHFCSCQAQICIDKRLYEQRPLQTIGSVGLRTEILQGVGV